MAGAAGAAAVALGAVAAGLAAAGVVEAAPGMVAASDADAGMGGVAAAVVHGTAPPDVLVFAVIESAQLDCG